MSNISFKIIDRFYFYTDQLEKQKAISQSSYVSIRLSSYLDKQLNNKTRMALHLKEIGTHLNRDLDSNEFELCVNEQPIRTIKLNNTINEEL